MFAKLLDQEVEKLGDAYRLSREGVSQPAWTIRLGKGVIGSREGRPPAVCVPKFVIVAEE